MVTNNCTNVASPFPIGNGGTGQITAATAFNALSPLTTTSDIIGHDGTNNIRFAASATAGSILSASSAASSGLAWAAGGPVFQSTKVITSAQVKTLVATPQTIVPAPGAGVINIPIFFVLKMAYGGNNAFSGTSSLNLAYKGDGSSNTIIVQPNITAFLSATTSRYFMVLSLLAGARAAASTAEANVIKIYKTGSEITGNAAGDNTLTVVTYYYQVTI